MNKVVSGVVHHQRSPLAWLANQTFPFVLSSHFLVISITTHTYYNLQCLVFLCIFFHCACRQEHDILVFSSLMLFSFAICKICSIWLYSIRIASLFLLLIIYITWHCWQKSHAHMWRKPMHCTYPCCSLHSCSR
jgi:hypothetical protein